MRESEGKLKSAYLEALRQFTPERLLNSIAPPWKETSNWGVLVIGKGAAFFGKPLLAESHVREFRCLDKKNSQVFKDPQREELERLGVLFYGNHPIPGEESFTSTQKILDWLKAPQSKRAFNKIAVFILGGSSSLFFLPKRKGEGSVESLQKQIQDWLKKGLSIQELNQRRNELCLLKKGGLLHFLREWDYESIWSGLVSDVPTVAMDRLFFETVGGGIMTDDKTHPLVLASQRDFLKTWAQKFGKRVEIRSNPCQEPIKTYALNFINHALALRKGEGFLEAGELLVPLEKEGYGGRQSELTCRVLLEILKSGPQKFRSFEFLFGATDGNDGSTPFAGYSLEGELIERWVRGKNLVEEIENALHRGETGRFLNEWESANRRICLEVGPTGTNLSDVYGVFHHERG